MTTKTIRTFFIVDVWGILKRNETDLTLIQWATYWTWRIKTKYQSSHTPMPALVRIFRLIRPLLLKRLAVSWRVVFKCITRELTGRKMFSRKRCRSNRHDCLWRIIKKSKVKNLRELHKEWTEAGVSVSRATTQRHLQEREFIPNIKALLNHCQMHLTWAKEKNNCFSVVQSVFGN